MHAMFEIVSLQMYMNDRGPISGPLKGWETTPAISQAKLVSIQQALINYVWEKEVPNADVFFQVSLCTKQCLQLLEQRHRIFVTFLHHQIGRTDLVLK